jgi:hypothetical protein
MTEEVDHLQARSTVVGMASERSGLNATDRGLCKFRQTERIDSAERHRAAIAA